MNPLIDLAGQRFGSLVATTRAPNSNCGQTVWNFRCDCGTEVARQPSSVKRGKHPSCGCFFRQPFTARGILRTRSSPDDFRRTWSSIKDRCTRASHPNFADYGGRGISICDQWMNDYEAFHSWLMENIGPRPDAHSLDRVDNDRGYEPGNLRWATQTQQMANVRPKVTNAQYIEVVAERDLWRQRACDLGWTD